MRLAIISDIHDNLANLDKVLNWVKNNKINKIICLGDITNNDTLAHLATNFGGEIFVVRGNGEIYDPALFKRHPKLKDLGQFGVINLGEIKIGCCHKPQEIDQLFSNHQLDFIFYGHTHKPWLEDRQKTLIANPGNLAGIFHPATFAILDVKHRQLELKILADLK